MCNECGKYQKGNVVLYPSNDELIDFARKKAFEDIETSKVFSSNDSSMVKILFED